MTGNEFVKVIVEQNPGMIQDDVRKIVKLVFEGMREAIRTGESLTIPGLGTIYPHFQKARDNWTNPFSGNKERLESRVKLKFRPSKKMQEYLTENMIDMFEYGSE